MTLSTDYIRTSLQNLYGDIVTSPDLKAWCAMNDTTYPTVSKKLDQFKVGRGKWNLTDREQMEKTYQSSPSSITDQESQNLIPQKDDTFVRFGNFADIKRLLRPVYSIRRSLRVYLATAKRSPLSKRVLNWVEK